MKFARALLCSVAVSLVVGGIALARPAVNLHFSGHLLRRVHGKTELKPVEGVTLRQGDVVQYTIDAANSGDEAAVGLNAVGPVPAHMAYVSGSARAEQPAKIEYSVDGKNFSPHPTQLVKTAKGMVRKPVPPGDYVSVRFTALRPLPAKATFHYSYEVSVK